jgi:hypothetical protein
MLATPGPVFVAPTHMLPVATRSHRSPRREFLVGWWSRAALVALVFLLGLLQGSRAALGDLPLRAAAEIRADAPAQAATPGVVENDALRGRFFRPAGSNAVRPALRMRPSVWTPHSAARRVACSAPGC